MARSFAMFLSQMENDMKTISLAFFLVWCLTVSVCATQLLFEGFNEETIPAGWTVELINQEGATTPTLIPVTSTLYPTGRAPYEGDRCLRFNSYDARAGSSVRLAQTTPFSTEGHDLVRVRFAWLRDSAFSGADDRVVLEYSLTGAVWEEVAVFSRYHSALAAWEIIDLFLPPEAGDQPTLYLGFRFISEWGYNCHFDALEVSGLLYNIYVEPSQQTHEGAPGATVSHTLTLHNRTEDARTYVFGYESPWEISGPLATLAPVPSFGSTSVTVSVNIPADAVAQVSTARVTVASADALYSTFATLITRCTWEATEFYAPFDSWPDGWATYQSSAMPGWVHNLPNGTPPPCAWHEQTFVTGGVSWLVSPAIDLSNDWMEELHLEFDFATLEEISGGGVYISTGSRDPIAGDYERLAYYDYIINQWYLNRHDFSAYKGSSPVYIAFRYVGPDPAHYLDSVRLFGRKTGITSARLVGPPSYTAYSYSLSPIITGMVYSAGLTGGVDPPSHVEAQVGYGHAGSAPDAGEWTWTNAVFAGSWGSNAVFHGQMYVTVSGEIDYAYRFRIAHGPWVYADMREEESDYDSAYAGKATIASRPLHGRLLHEQAPTLALVSARPSYVTPLYYVETADDVMLPYRAEIHAITWKGRYTLDERPGDASGFFVRIYADDGDMPATLVYEEYHAGFAEEYVQDSFNGVYTYQVLLRTPFVVMPATRYWLSLQSDVPEGYSWNILRTSTGVGLSAHRRMSRTDPWEARTEDLVFALYGEPEGAGVLTGHVRAAHDAHPIAHAQITLSNEHRVIETTTDSEGAYTIITLPETYTLRATAEGYELYDSVVTLVADSVTTYDITLVGSVLTYAPHQITERLMPGEQSMQTITVTNTGPRDISFVLQPFEVMAPQAGLSTPSDLAPPAEPPVVLCYAFTIGPPTNEVITFMSDAPETFLTRVPSVIRREAGDFVSGADFLLNDFSTLYAIQRFSDYLLQVRVDDGSTNLIATVTTLPGFSWTGMAAAPDGFLYLVSSDVNATALYRVDAHAGASTFIGFVQNAYALIDIAFNAHGELYGLDIVQNALMRIDPKTAKGTIVGDVGFNANFAQGMGFDTRHNILYLAAYNDTASRSELRIADTTTGETTLIGVLPERIDGFAVATSAGAEWCHSSTNRGTIAAGGVSTLTVTCDTTPLTRGGIYHSRFIWHGDYVNDPPPIEVTLIVPTVPIIDAPAVCDFGDVLIGETHTQVVHVANSGLGVVTGEVTGVSAPFFIEPPAAYMIGTDAPAPLTFVFAPDVEGDYTNVVYLSGGGGAEMTLQGTAIPEPTSVFILVLLCGAGALALSGDRRFRA